MLQTFAYALGIADKEKLIEGLKSAFRRVDINQVKTSTGLFPFEMTFEVEGRGVFTIPCESEVFFPPLQSGTYGTKPTPRKSDGAIREFSKAIISLSTKTGACIKIEPSDEEGIEIVKISSGIQ